MAEMPLDGDPPPSGLQADFEGRSLGDFFRRFLNKKEVLRRDRGGTRLQRHYIETGLGSDEVMSMLSKSDLSRARVRSLFLALLMILSTTAALATTASASVSRTYTTNRDPVDVAIGDFDCDGNNDLAIATEGTHTLSILWNDGNGDFSERDDVWVAGNQSRNADWDEFANVEQVEVGEFTGDNAPDIVIYQLSLIHI